MPMTARSLRSSAFLLLGVFTVSACRPRGGGVFHGDDLAGPLIVPPLPKPELVLWTTEGTRFDLKKETEGFVTLLFFGYTHCPDLCPVQMANIASAMQRIDADVASRIKVVFVTVDPRRDTPEVTRAWLNHFDSRFIGLTGDSASIASAFTQLRLGHPAEPAPVQGDSTAYTINHNVVVLAFTTDDLAHVAYPSGIHPEQWASDLRALVKRS
jgi:protein SCO1/2